MQMVLQVSKIVLQTNIFIGHLIHKVEVAQFNAIKNSACGQNHSVYKKFTLKNILII